MKLDVNEEDNTNQSNSRPNDHVDEITSQNDDNLTRDILDAEEIASHAAEVRQMTITRQYIHHKKSNQMSLIYISLSTFFSHLFYR